MAKENDSNMLSAEQLIDLFSELSKDARITVWHLGICMAIAQQIYHSKINPVAVTRKIVMRLAHVRSIATYHKCINQLIVFGYIKYSPSYSYYNRSHIELVITRDR